MDGIWDFCTPVKQLPLTVQHLPSAVAWKGSKWMAPVWAESGYFGEFPFFAPLHPENGGCGYCSAIVHAQLADGCDLLSWATGWKIPFQSAVGRSPWLLMEMKEGLEKVCRKQNWFPLCCMREKVLSDMTVSELTLVTWAWKNKNNKWAPVGQRNWQSLVQD